MGATFLRHEGFLGAMGAFLKVNPMQTPPTRRLQQVRLCRQTTACSSKGNVKHTGNGRTACQCDIIICMLSYGVACSGNPTAWAIIWVQWA